MDRVLLVKTAPEISLKSSFVRRQFMSSLENNIRSGFWEQGVEFGRIKRAGGRLFIETGDESAAAAMQKTFGVHSMVFAERHVGGGAEAIALAAEAYARENIAGAKSFAVRANRVGARGLTSKEVEEKAGARIALAIPGIKVNLSKPEKTVFLEIFSGEFYLYSEGFFGLGGLPVGVSGKIGVFFDEGSRGELACALLLMKRGCRVFAVQEEGSQNADSLLEELFPWNAFRRIKKGGVGEAKKAGCVGFARADSRLSEKKAVEYASFDRAMGELVLRPLLLAPSEGG